jgi:hypothetical protein
VCTPKPPKVSKSDPVAKTPDPAVIRNTYLDDATSFAQNRQGRSQLRIDPGAPVGIRIPLPGSAPTTPTAPATPRFARTPARSPVGVARLMAGVMRVQDGRVPN